MSVGADIAPTVAFVAGVVSFASPCCLPLMPAYVGYMVGTAGDVDRRRAFLHGLAFSLGFTLVFVAFWASIGLIGYALGDNARLLRQAGGGVLIFLGLQTAGVLNVSVLWRDLRPMPAMGGAGGGTFTLGGPAGTPGLGRSLAFGTFFAAGWSPCIGPILGGIVGLASVQTTVGHGTVLLLAYAGGLAVPFIAVALGASWVATRLAWVSRHHRAVSLVSGGLLIALGTLMVTDTLARLAALTAPLGA